MTRRHFLGALIGALVVLALTSMYPLKIDENLVCGGVTGRVAITGPARSTGGELTPDVLARIETERHRCQVKARRLLLGAAALGAGIGYTYVLVTRVRESKARPRG